MSHNTFDIIIAGGGTSGLIIASRLATADPSLSILVVEAGAPTRDDPQHIQPVRYLHHLRPDSTTVKFHVGRESAALGGRAPVVPCGQCLGGGSSVNFAMYTRAAASDYDDWTTVYGNPGWSSTELLPLLRKCETYEVAPGKPTHGYSGPLKVSYGGAFMDIGKEFLEVAAGYDKARGLTDDVNGLFETNKYGVSSVSWIDSKTGARSDIPHQYIYHRDFPNLHILTGYHVQRVIVKDGQATGIEYSPNKRYHSDAGQGVLSAIARRQVVISAGTFGSPAILERSGIGSKSVLEKVGIMQIVDLPGVGENYQDHQVLFAPYVIAKEKDTLDGIASSNEAELQKWDAQWKKQGDGLMAHNGLDAGGKLRPSKDDLDVLGEVFRKRWLEYYVPAPDKPVMWFGLLALYLGDLSKVPVDKAYSVGWYLQHPASIGRLHITSRDNVEAPLDFHPGYLDRPEDMAVHKWGYKMSREFARRMPSYRGEVPGAHPAFSETSSVAPRLHDSPVPNATPSLVYTEEDEKALEDWIRKTVATAWHSLGTCAMKSREKGGVVDSRLNVYDVDGLKVADMSICPGNVSANTYSTAILIGEKAAVLIGQELGIHIDDGLTPLARL
ncbi:alcohol oxidase-like protein [Dichomitus squalens LYAD-421 SS1]|uniref:Alcohol oxidase-like protein n=1 Tax=Dichomitus squalens (strain LYAD-421) TaxID=732165 RepID=R7SR78_DICSQ|nr:alcohol oxidase-like protein [Dichomitus squalens LYAD-421 SS1]EJF57487.1 alcohol oxidase-like protein [Dichomitus squalens LYAD-421 SS1]